MPSALTVQGFRDRARLLALDRLIPRIVTACEWAPVESGVMQCMQAVVLSSAQPMQQQVLEIAAK